MILIPMTRERVLVNVDRDPFSSFVPHVARVNEQPRSVVPPRADDTPADPGRGCAGRCGKGQMCPIEWDGRGHGCVGDTGRYRGTVPRHHQLGRHGGVWLLRHLRRGVECRGHELTFPENRTAVRHWTLRDGRGEAATLWGGGGRVQFPGGLGGPPIVGAATGVRHDRRHQRGVNARPPDVVVCRDGGRLRRAPAATGESTESQRPGRRPGSHPPSRRTRHARRPRPPL